MIQELFQRSFIVPQSIIYLNDGLNDDCIQVESKLKTELDVSDHEDQDDFNYMFTPLDNNPIEPGVYFVNIKENVRDLK